MKILAPLYIYPLRDGELGELYNSREYICSCCSLVARVRKEVDFAQYQYKLRSASTYLHHPIIHEGNPGMVLMLAVLL